MVKDSCFAMIYSLSFRLNDDTVAVVDFMLNDLRSEATEAATALDEAAVQILNFDGFKAFARAFSHERKTTLLSFVRAGFFYNNRIYHRYIKRSMRKNNDTLADTDHVGSKADTFFFVGLQSIKQVSDDLYISSSCRGGLLS